MTLRDMIERHEGRKRYVYKDHLGFDTIGVGICVDKRKGGLTDEEIDYLRDNRIRIAESRLEGLSWYDGLSSTRQDVIVSMVFQLGLNGTLRFKKMIAAIEAEDYQEAAEQMKDSRWHIQTPERCEELAEMMATGEYRQLLQKV